MKIISGMFLRPDGSPAAGATLKLLLSGDAYSNGGQIIHSTITIDLDETGSIPSGTEILACDELSPTGLFYWVSVIDEVFGQCYHEKLSITGSSPISLNDLSPSA